jgi:tRNA A37 threonylcarbamoyladenosine biosynthesis protein TsaE
MSATSASLISADVSQTHAIAAALAKQCRTGDCILLTGDLGAGKTTFARGFIQALNPSAGEVVSPTFTLVQTYPITSCPPLEGGRLNASYAVAQREAGGDIQCNSDSPPRLALHPADARSSAPHQGGSCIYHFDLYRLKNPSELAEIGLEEAFHAGISLIEWPEMLQSRLPEDALNVTISIGSQPDERRFTLTGSKAWRARLEKLKEAL